MGLLGGERCSPLRVALTMSNPKPDVEHCEGADAGPGGSLEEEVGVRRAREQGTRGHRSRRLPAAALRPRGGATHVHRAGACGLDGIVSPPCGA